LFYLCLLAIFSLAPYSQTPEHQTNASFSTQQLN
jgi:hypothetical protein